MAEFAVAITFPQNSTTYEALSKLSSATGFEVRSAAIVERDKDGHLHVPEGDDAMAGVGTAGGSLIGMLIGVLGGPVGMLLGWGAGAATGALYDDTEARKIIEECYEQALATLRGSRDRLDRLAHTLLERETLDEDDAYAAAGIGRDAAPGAIARGEAAGPATARGLVSVAAQVTGEGATAAKST